MEKPKASPIFRLMPSLTDAAFLLPVIIIYGRLQGAKLLLGDGDTGWHIRAGEWILANGRVPRQDIFSYTKEGAPWFAWEWLWDVIFAWLHQHGGLASVVIASLLVLCFTFALLYRLVRRPCSNDLVAFGVTALAAAGSSPHWLARPHLFTLLFVVVFLHVLERAREGRTGLLWALPVLTLLWTNLHGGFFVGIFLICCYAGGELIAWLIEEEREKRQFALRRAIPFLYAAAGCAAASFVNPYFYQLHVHISNYLRDPFLFKHVQEFQPTSFQHPGAYYYGPVLLLGVLAAAWCAKQRRYEQTLLLAAWIWLGLYAVRNVPIAMLVCAPAVAEMVGAGLAHLREVPLAPWIRRAAASWAALSAEFSSLDRTGRAHVVSLMAVAVVSALHFLPAPPSQFIAKYDPKRYPENALMAIGSPAAAGRIFTHDEWGDYLIYKLYPQVRVFIDGRSDMYGETFNRQYLNVMSIKPGWRNTLDGYQVDTVLLPVKESLAAVLKESREWRPVYDDGMAIVFRKSGSAEIVASRTNAAGVVKGRTEAQDSRAQARWPVPPVEQVSVSSHSEGRENPDGRAAIRINQTDVIRGSRIPNG